MMICVITSYSIHYTKLYEDFLCEKGPFDVVLSDAAPSTTGNRLIDTAKSYDLVLQIINLTDNILKQGGNAVYKVFQGEDSKVLFDKMKEMFKDRNNFV